MKNLKEVSIDMVRTALFSCDLSGWGIREKNMPGSGQGNEKGNEKGKGKQVIKVMDEMKGIIGMFFEVQSSLLKEDQHWSIQ